MITLNLPENEMTLVGYSHLINHYNLNVPAPLILSAISRKHVKYKTDSFFSTNYEIFKDGLVRKNNRDFASFNPKQFDIWRSYKKLHFTKKKGWFKNKEIDISIDEDIFLFMISDYFNLDIPFREIED